MSADEYVIQFFTGLHHPDITPDEVRAELRKIESSIRLELSEELKGLTVVYHNRVPDYAVHNLVAKYNQKWNRISDAITGLIGHRIMSVDHILDLWMEIIELLT